MDFVTASSLFQATAAARGWQVVSEGQEVLVQCRNAGLRLRPCGAGVMLEVTHGPVDALPAGWLDIYSDPTGPDVPSLAECIEYGLDLMQPAINKGIEAERDAMARIDPTQFADRVYEASKAAFSALLADNTGQTFYAFALFTDDSLQFIHPAANTEEALTATVRRYRETVDPKYGTSSTRTGMRWSYGDWGFFPYEDGDHFAEVNRLLSENFDKTMADETFDGGLDALWDAALVGFQRLESEGFFGTGSARSTITLLPVGDLPVELGQAWVSALNPPDVAERFANYDADAPEGGASE